MTFKGYETKVVNIMQPTEMINTYVEAKKTFFYN